MPEPAVSIASRSGSPTLVGRDRELALLRERLAAALAGRGGLVLIAGEAGIGKTALAEALTREAAERGMLVLTGHCYDLSETPPYGPWTELFGRYPTAGDLPPLPGVLAQRGAFGPVASREVLFAQIRDFLVEVGARRPLVLFLDDLHWADPASLELLRVLACGLSALPLLLVVAYRAEDVPRHHPLYQLVPLLVHDAPTVRLTLPALDRDAVRALVAARHPLPEADAARLAAYLQHRAEGNPFYIRELLRALEEGGLLLPGDGGWALGDLAGARLPPFLRQVIEGRLARLGAEAQRLLALAGVIGQEVPLGLWGALAQVEEEALLELVERAAEAHVLEEMPDGARVRFAHALIREALYEGLSAPRRRLVHRRAAEALIALPNPDPDAVAHHLRQAGDAWAADWLIRAGERAQRAYAWLTAAERYEAALEMLGEGGPPRERAALLLTLAQLRRYADPGWGVARLVEAARLAEEAGDPVLAAAARFDRGHLCCLIDRGGGELGQGIAEMEAAFPALAALPPVERARLPAPAIQAVAPGEEYHRGALMNWLAGSGRFAETLRLGEAMIARGPGTTFRGLMGLFRAYGALGRPEEARRAVADARAAAEARGQYLEVGDAYINEMHLVLTYLTDDLAERQRVASGARAAYERAGGVLGRVPATFVSLPLLLLEGRWDEARQFPPRALGALALWQGDFARARAVVRERLPWGPATAPGGTGYVNALINQRRAAALALALGEPAEARAWLAAHDRWLAWAGATPGRAEGALGWADYHRATGDPAQAREQAEQALADASNPRQPLALLAAHRLLGELATEAGRHAEAHAHLDEALALAEACTAPYQRALTLLALAELRAATGQRDEVGALLGEVRAICTPLDARPALARADALAARLALLRPACPTYPAGLTVREVEVLRLIAAGKSNREIAAAVCLSPRTVERHITHIYRKIDAHGKADATAFAYRHRLT